jgi:hypothetical protein
VGGIALAGMYMPGLRAPITYSSVKSAANVAWIGKRFRLVPGLTAALRGDSKN